jgi:cell wall-associated NlpC family hydrolase
MSVLTWLRDIGARWAAPRVEPPELAAVEREIAAAPDPRAARVVARALSMVGRGIYGLGKGGRHPDAPTPFDASGRCDCSGFALAWCYGWDRYAPGLIDGDWHSTRSAYDDAKGKRRFWREVPWSEARTGDAVTYPTRPGRIGHCGVLVEIGPTLAESLVTHCHGGKGPAVSVGTGALWTRKQGIVVRPVAWG